MTPAISVGDTADVPAWRFQRVRESGLDAVACLLPHNVLMLSGYRPRLGSGAVLAMADGEVRLAVPLDEFEAASAAVAVATVIGYNAGGLDELVPVEAALTAALRRLATGLPQDLRVGFEDKPSMTPNAYVSTLQLGSSLTGVLRGALPGAQLEPASELLRELRGRLSDSEASRVRRLCPWGAGVRSRP
jgi:hypothetical protein